MKLTNQDVILLFVGYCLGEYVLPTLVVFGITVHWALIGLIISLSIPWFKKLAGFLWNRFIKAIKYELNK